MLPRREQEVVDFIQKFHRENNRFPFQKEIADGIGVFSSFASHILRRLRKKEIVVDKLVIQKSGKPRVAFGLDYKKLSY